MKDLILDATKTTPAIKFDALTGILELSGSSYPENPFCFFDPAMEWLTEYIKLGKKITFNFRLTYYNTSSSKQILDIIDLLEEYYILGGEVEANWHYKEGDEEIKDSGDEFFEDIEMPYQLVKYKK